MGPRQIPLSCLLDMRSAPPRHPLLPPLLGHLAWALQKEEMVLLSPPMPSLSSVSLSGQVLGHVGHAGQPGGGQGPH